MAVYLYARLCSHKKLKGAQSSEIVKSRVSSICFLYKTLDSLVTQEKNCPTYAFHRKTKIPQASKS